MGRDLTSLPISASFQYLLQKSGSEVNDGLGADVDYLNISASYAYTASVADSATSASYATTATSASHALQADNATTAGSATTATSASHAVSADSAISSSYAVTASYAENVTPINTGSFYVSSSITDATITFTQGDGSTEVVEVNNVSSSISASHALQADSALVANTATSASHALIADNLVPTANININSITASEASFTSASIGYLQSITGSAKIIGDAFIILNNNTPTERYAGIKVQDSGSTDVTSSLLWDGQTNDWKYEFSSSAAHEGGILLFGPEGTDLGTLPYPTANTLQKGTGGHHLEDSSITDDGTLVTINANVSASGYISASEFIGDLTGNATTTTSASYATTASYAISVESAERAFDGFTVTGSADQIIIVDNGDLTKRIDLSWDENNNSFEFDSFGTVAGATFIIDETTFTKTQLSNISASGYISASEFIGDGSGLTNLPGAAAFPFTGSAEISGSLTMEGPGNLILNSTAGTPNNISSTDPAGNFILGGAFNTISGNNGFDLANGIVVSYNSTISSNGHDNFIAACNTSTISGTCQDSAIVGGNTHTISGAGFNTIAGGDDNTISGGSTTRSFIGGGQGNTITHSRSAIIGGLNLSTTKADEVVVPNLDINGTVVQNVTALTITSNTASLDASTGNMFTLGLQNAADTHLELTNQVAGQTFQIQIKNNATAAGTISFDSQFEFEGGTPFTATAATNAVDILTFTCFGGNVQCVGSKNFS